jgi:F-type H+-transporting ATPase subunit epsilon
MFERKFPLEIVTPSRIVFRGEACSIVVPGVVAPIGILAGHIPFLTILDIGEVMVREEPDVVRYLALSGGFLEVLPDKVTILADTAEWAEEIDVERAERARRRAMERLKEGGPEVDMERALLSLRRAQNRLKVASRLVTSDEGGSK